MTMFRSTQFHCRSVCMLRVTVLLESKHSPKCQVLSLKEDDHVLVGLWWQEMYSQHVQNSLRKDTFFSFYAFSVIVKI